MTHRLPVQTAVVEPVRLGHGAIAIIDALGWKGIWRRFGAGPVLAAARALRDGVMQHTAPHAEAFAKGPINVFMDWPERADLFVRFLSDTIVIGVGIHNIPSEPTITMRYGDEDIPINTASYVETLEGVQFAYVCEAVAETIRRAALLDIPLMYRGAIAVGDFHVDEHNFIIGPAVDEAAELMNQADGAFVICHPANLHRVVADKTGHCLEFPVPLKDGRTVRTSVVNPFYMCTSENEAERVQAGIMRAFGKAAPLEIEIKRQHTTALLAAALNASRRPLP